MKDDKSTATNTTPLCGDCGHKPRLYGGPYCRECLDRLRDRIEREQAGEISPTAFDDERIGK